MDGQDGQDGHSVGLAIWNSGLWTIQLKPRVKDEKKVRLVPVYSISLLDAIEAIFHKKDVGWGNPFYFTPFTAGSGWVGLESRLPDYGERLVEGRSYHVIPWKKEWEREDTNNTFDVICDATSDCKIMKTNPTGDFSYSGNAYPLVIQDFATSSLLSASDDLDGMDLDGINMFLKSVNQDQIEAATSSPPLKALKSALMNLICF